MTGYAHASYAASLAEFGAPRPLPYCGGWALARAIPGRAERDLAGCYPLFCCRDWSGLAADLRDLGDEFVSLVLVADPFGRYDAASLRGVFNRGAAPFKEHVVVEFGGYWREAVCRHHRRNARKALRHVTVERLDRPLALLDDWCQLYDNLTRRHDIRGVAAFSRASFARQFVTPGLVAFRAVADAETVGMLLWYHQGEMAYYHLGAFSDRGYELGAAFALFWTSLETFAIELSYATLGAEAGPRRDPAAGLNRFKRGWAGGTRPSYLCRHVFDTRRYDELTRGLAGPAYFPAYRADEGAPREAAHV